RAEPVWQDVKAGILRSVSVGYSVEKWADSAVNGTRVRTAVQWTPKELSLVAVPADPGAVVRGEMMDTKTQTQDDGATQTRAVTNAEIRRLTDAAHLDRTVADALIDRNASLDDAKRELFDAVVQRQTPIVQHQRVELGTNHDAAEVKLE